MKEFLADPEKINQEITRYKIRTKENEKTSNMNMADRSFR